MNSEFVTQWLYQPNTPIDPAGLEALCKAYPYFIPARYMDAAQQHTRQPFSPPMLAAMQLYMGNWLLFHGIMNASEIESAYTVAGGMVPPAEFVPQSPPPEAAAPVSHLHQQPTTDSIPLIPPVFTGDYFLHQGLHVADSIPAEMDHAPAGKEAEAEDPKSLMVVMSFSEWLMHFRTKSQKEKEEEEDRRALRSMWQKEKLAAALEEENDEIPENVFEMAVNSITKEDDLVSESLAEIMVRQGKRDKAIDMYKKLSLRNPQKSGYFAQQIALIQKNSEA